MRIMLELEVEEITDKMVLFESIGTVTTENPDVSLKAERSVPMGAPILWSPGEERRYMVSIGEVYKGLAKAIMELKGVMPSEE